MLEQMKQLQMSGAKNENNPYYKYLKERNQSNERMFKSATPIPNISKTYEAQSMKQNAPVNYKSQLKETGKLAMSNPPVNAFYQRNLENFYGMQQDRTQMPSRVSQINNLQQRQQNHQQENYEPYQKGSHTERSLNTYESNSQRKQFSAYWNVNPILFPSNTKCQGNVYPTPAYRGKGLKQLNMALPKSLDNRNAFLNKNFWSIPLEYRKDAAMKWNK